MTIGLSLLTGLAGAAVLAGPAQAASSGYATMRMNNMQAVFWGAPGSANQVVVTASTKSVIIDDVVPIRTGPGCAVISKDRTVVRCTYGWVMDHAPRVVVYAGDRDDRVTNRTKLWTELRGGAGNDTIQTAGGPSELYGEAGADTILGSAAEHEFLDGGPGADRIYGGAGAEQIFGGAGDDTLSGGAGRDQLTGGAGSDLMSGGADDDLLYMQTDTITGDNDRVLGDTGTDTVSYTGYGAGVTVDLDGVAGDDGARGERDTLHPDIERIQGGGGGDLLWGSGRDDVILGGPGDDTIIGGSGADKLVGEEGADRLYGGAGDDALDGRDWVDWMSRPYPPPDVPDLVSGGVDRDTCELYPGDVPDGCDVTEYPHGQ
ncbi:calcium-binding protein [Actinoplanes utahensis]|uniref:calcium-binding protein n=1 Tax=Actinoplanes utahensis TaxID=1869 RepID=UPI0013787DE3|nr:calcium-binding protein [Actinoplanes utahensis]GIF29547.1 hypothetical protein Aut01nite_25330 [Actinoplanes utahensis]